MHSQTNREIVDISFHLKKPKKILPQWLLKETQNDFMDRITEQRERERGSPKNGKKPASTSRIFRLVESQLCLTVP